MRNFFLSVKIFVFILTVAAPCYSQLSSNAAWPMFHQNAQHSGQTNKAVLGPGKNPFIKWTYLADGPMYVSSPAVGSDNTVYVGGSDGKLYAIKDGVQKWAYATGGDIFTSPAIGRGDIIYFGSSDKTVYAVSNGNLKWSFQTNGAFNSSPAIGSNNVVYIGNNNGMLFALTNGFVKWATNLGSSIDSSSPAIAKDGTIYIGAVDDKLYAVTNGKVKWSTNLGSDVVSAPVIGKDGIIYVTTYAGRLYAFQDMGNKPACAPKWNYFDSLSGSRGYSSPAVDDNNVVYFGTFNMNTLYAVTNGVVKWQYMTPDAIYSSPAAGSDGCIFFGSRNGSVYAVTNGILKWSLSVSTVLDRSSPALGNNKDLYIAAGNSLVAVREENFPVLSWSSNAGYLNDGVSPNTNYDGALFNFEIRYRDYDNDAPIIKQLRIDLNNNGTFETGECFAMVSNSGINYSNGIVYSRPLHVFKQGSGIINYQFYFVNQYGFSNSSSVLTVKATNGNGIHQIAINRNLDTGNNFSGFTNQTIAAYQIWDSQGDVLKKFSIGNAGNMAAGTHIRKVRLWYDRNSDFTWNAGDLLAGDLAPNGAGRWTNNNITFATTLAFPHFNYVVTVDFITNNVKESNCFKPFIPVNGISCSGSLSAPSSAVTNSQPISIGSFLLLRSLQPGLSLSSIAFGDINNDGNMDMVYIGNDGALNYLQYCLGNGSGGFNSPVGFGKRISDGSIALGDIDNDGHLDLVVTGVDDGGSRVLDKYINPGSGNFSAYSIIGVENGTAGGQIALGDLNNDGSLDIVLCGYGEFLSRYMNNGSGYFYGPIKIDAALAFSSIALGDLNNDGYPDIVASGFNESQAVLEKFMNNGNGGFGSAVNFGVPLDNSSIALGDIDDDGYLDLVAAGADNRLDYYANDGNGDFLSVKKFGTPAEFASIALCDVNNDGKLDLITSGSNHQQSYVLKRYLNLNGKLTNEAGFGTGAAKGALAVCDLNNDGSADLIVTGLSASGRRFDYYRNMAKVNNIAPLAAPGGLAQVNHNGFWRFQWNQPADDHTVSPNLLRYHVAIGIVRSGQYEYCSTNICYPAGQANLGDVSVSASNFLQTTIPVSRSVYWKVCGIDTSFKKGAYSGESSFASSSVDAVFVTTNMTMSGTNMLMMYVPVMDIKVSDSHGHKLKSFAVGNAGTMKNGTDIAKIRLWWDSGGSRQFEGTNSYICTLNWNGSFWTNNNINWDLGASGKDILVTVDYASAVRSGSNFKAYIPVNTVFCISNNSAPADNLTNQNFVWYIPLFDEPDGTGCNQNATTLAVGDLNRDGRLDFVESGYVPGKINYVAIKNAARNFSIIGSGGIDRGDILLGDINNDGVPDTVWTGEDDGGSTPIYRMLNNGSGVFGNLLSIGRNLSESCICLGDVNNDGSLDLIGAGRTAINIWLGQYAGDIRLEVSYNNGDGTFSAPQPFGIPLTSYCYVALGDINNDGWLDLVTAGNDGTINRLNYYLNKGDGTFGDPVSFGTGNNNSCISFGDLNNDGWLDIIVTGSSGMFRYLNNKDGSFSERNFGNSVSSRAISLGDIDNDGDLDLVATANTGNDIYFNDGYGNFSRNYPIYQTVSLGYRATGALADFDNDGSLDLVSGANYVGVVFWNAVKTINSPPNTPINLSAARKGYYWKLKWSPNSMQDDHTSDKMLRYQIAIGTGDTFNGFNFVSTNLEYPRGQANLGNVSTSTGCFYESHILVNQTVWWKVRSIDTSFKTSGWSSVIQSMPLGTGPYYVATNGSDSNPGSLPKPFKTIQKAVDSMSGGSPPCVFPWTYVFPGTYKEQVMIRSNKNDGEGYMGISAISNNKKTVLNGENIRDYGFYITNSQKLRILGFEIKNYNNTGIKVAGNLTNFIIANNKIYSNIQYGIYINGNADNYSIYSNAIYGSTQAVGLYVHGGDNYNIFQNTFSKNQNYNLILSDANSYNIYRNLFETSRTNICIGGITTNINFINNTVFKSIAGDGIVWDNASAGKMINNIFLSNAQYAVRNRSSGNVILRYNDFFANISGVTSGPVIWGKHNLTNNPYLDTVTSFTIASRLSCVLDVATNIPGYSSVFQGFGPDMGWKESSLSRFYPGPFYVDVTNGWDNNPGSLAQPYQTIQRAATKMGSGVDVTSATTFVFPGMYAGQNNITQNVTGKYMVFTPYFPTNYPVLDGGGSAACGFNINNANKVVVNHFNIQNYSGGAGIIMQNNSYSNYIRNNLIHNISSSGISLNWGGVNRCFVISNQIYNISGSGVLIYDSDSIMIARNLIRNCSQDGINLTSWAVTNLKVWNNTLYANGQYGIIMYNDGSKGQVLNNIIMGHSICGIGATGTWVNQILSDYNDFYNNTTNMRLISYISNGPSNRIGNPAINTLLSSYEITSSFSWAVDKGKSIPNISDTWSGGGPDIGWKESVFFASNIPDYLVHILPPKDYWTTTITNAVSQSSNNCIIECLAVPNDYFESIRIANRTNLTVRVASWSNSKNNSISVIDSSGKSRSITISNSKKIRIEGFTIKKASQDGIAVIDSFSNCIIGNNITQHGDKGINLTGDVSDGNSIVSNSITGNGNYGINMADGDLNTVSENFISQNSKYGIYLNGSSSSNLIDMNSICSNTAKWGNYGGIILPNGNANYNTISQNRIFGQCYYGFYQQNGQNTRIIKNLITDTYYSGIRLNAGANVDIINNDFYRTSTGTTGDGAIYGCGTPTRIYNNIFISNKGYGLYNVGSMQIGYNLFIGNASGNFLGTPTLNEGNIFDCDPLLDMVTSFTIKSMISPCVDNATNIPGITDGYEGSFPDIGWKEFHCGNTNKYVHILLPMNRWTNTIANALTVTTNNCVLDCYAKPGGFRGNNIMSNLTNVVLRSYNWFTISDSSSVIVNGSGRLGMRLNNCKKMKIQGFTFQYANNGIELTNSYSNRIEYNKLHNNANAGISYSGTVVGNSIMGNNIYNNQTRGILYNYANATNNNIVQNVLSNNGSPNIYFAGNNVLYENISKNIIYHTGTYGIYLDGSGIRFNTIKSNEISGLNSSGSTGIYLNFAGTNNIYRNLVHDHSSSGISVWMGSGGRIINNTLVKNGSATGIFSYYTTAIQIYNNIVLSNSGYGISVSGSGTLVDNVLYGNASGPWFGSAMTIGQGNVTNLNPRISSVSSCTIVSPLSPCVDSGLVVAGISSNYNGSGPDIGWKESGFVNNDVYVHVMPKDVWVKTIAAGIALATNNSTIDCYVKPGGFNGSNTISMRTNVMIRSYAWFSNGNMNVVQINGFNVFNGIYGRVLRIENSKNISVQGFTMLSGNNGLEITNSSSNRIEYNIFRNNSVNGINGNNIRDTVFYRNTMNNNSSYGAILNNSHNCLISRSIISYNTSFGLKQTNSSSNQIWYNSIYNNGSYGISGNNIRNIVFQSNVIFNNTIGIYYDRAYNCIIRSNVIRNNTGTGINYAGAVVSNLITGNKILNHGTRGIYYSSVRATNNSITMNIISNSGSQGIYYSANSIERDRVVKNTFCVFSDSGMWYNGGAGIRNNIIASNEIRDGHFGIYMQTGNSNYIYRNLIHHNQDPGISFTSGSGTIYNNTLFKIATDGIDLSSTSALIPIYNNIILSNAGPGIKGNARPARLGYNVIYGNSGGAWTGSALTIGSNNITNQNPMIDLTGLYAINSAASPCVDSATNIPGISSTFSGKAPDRGWRESGFLGLQFQGPFYVGNSWGSDSNDGKTWGTAFFSIQKAIDYCVSGFSNVIYVAGTGVSYTNPLATYAVAAITNCSGMSSDAPLNIMGYYSNSTFPVLNARGIEKFCFFLRSVTNVRIANFQNYNASIDGLMLRTNANRITVISNSFFRNAESGISILYSSNARILNNLVYSNNAHGIYNNYAKHCLFSSNRIWRTRDNYGIYVKFCTNNILAGNISYSNTHAAIFLESCQKDVVTNNTCRNGDWAALLIKNCNNERVYGNSISRSSSDGLRFELACTNLFVKNNTCSNNAASGIAAIGNIMSSTLRGNLCTYNNEKGIYLINMINCVLMSNTCTHDGQAGIMTVNGDNNIFEKNICANAAWAGILYNNANRGTFISNRSSQNTSGDGLKIEIASTNDRIFNNIFVSNGGKGFTAPQNITSATLLNNICAFNQEEGIYMTNSSQCVLGNNICFSNIKGIFLKNSMNTLVTNNACTQNPQAGIMLECGSSNTFIRNSCANAGWAGLLYKNANNGIFQFNRFVQNPGAGIQFELACTNILVANNDSSSNSIGINIITNTIASAVLINNFLSTNRAKGIYLNGTKNSLIRSNVIMRSVNQAIHGISLSNCRIVSNYIGFTHYQGIDIDSSSSYNAILYNTVSNSADKGINIMGGHNLVAKNRLVLNNYGIYLDGAGAHNNNIFSNRSMRNVVEGIFLQNVTFSTLNGNTCFLNSGAGIFVDVSTNILIQKNFSYSNQNSGIGLRQSATNRIFKNRVYRNNLLNVGDGIKLENCSAGNSIISNTSSSNVSHGIYIENTRSCLIRGNSCETNGKSGIGIVGPASNISVSSNNLSRNTMHGINFNGVDSSALAGNDCGYNHQYGIFLNASTACTLSGNRASYNNSDGIKADHSRRIRIANSRSWKNATGVAIGYNCTNVLVENSQVYSNINFGFWLGQNNRTTIQSNLIFGNTVNGGIFVEAADKDERIINNRIFENTSGIFYQGASGSGIIYRNTFERNTADGIRLTGGSSANIINNTFLSNKNNGISSDGSAGVSFANVKNCIFIGNSVKGITTTAGGTANVSYSCTNDGTSGAGISHGIGNITTSTLVTSATPGAEDLSLFWNSQAIGSGEAGPVLRPAMGAIVQYNVPSIAHLGMRSDHEIIFTPSYSNGSIPGDARIIVTYSGPGTFKLDSVKVSNTSPWGGTPGTWTRAVAGQVVTITRTGGAATVPGVTEDLILLGVTNTTTKGSNFKVTVDIRDSLDNRIDFFDGNYFKCFTNTSLSLSKTVSNIRLPGTLSSIPVPGTMIQYKLVYSNAGGSPQYNVMVIDRLPKNMTYWTNNMSSVSGWTLQYSTNATPSQGWLSASYTNVLPVPKDSVKWIRWKKPYMRHTEKTGSFVYSVIIK